MPQLYLKIHIKLICCHKIKYFIASRRSKMVVLMYMYVWHFGLFVVELKTVRLSNTSDSFTENCEVVQYFQQFYRSKVCS